MKNKLKCTNSHERIEMLLSHGIFGEEFASELKYIYDFLVKIRLKHQVFQYSSGIEINNYVSIDMLNKFEKDAIKHISGSISSMLSKLDKDIKF